MFKGYPHHDHSFKCWPFTGFKRPTIYIFYKAVPSFFWVALISSRDRLPQPRRAGATYHCVVADLIHEFCLLVCTSYTNSSFCTLLNSFALLFFMFVVFTTRTSTCGIVNGSVSGLSFFFNLAGFHKFKTPVTCRTRFLAPSWFCCALNSSFSFDVPLTGQKSTVYLCFAVSKSNLKIDIVFLPRICIPWRCRYPPRSFAVPSVCPL